VINFETDIGEPARWPTYYSLPAPLDSDGDGIPDYWEDQFGLDKHSAKDAVMDSDGDGYVNIEEYFNNTDPRGGTMPIVFLSASVSRAYRKEKRTGEFLVHRTGDLTVPLTVRYDYDGDVRTVAIPAGQDAVAVPVAPRASARTVATIAPDDRYHIGCPRSAMVVMEDGPVPVPVDITRIEPNGGVSERIHQIGDGNMQDHKKDKAIKHKTLYPL
jgi:hypothetical protein